MSMKVPFRIDEALFMGKKSDYLPASILTCIETIPFGACWLIHAHKTAILCVRWQACAHKRVVFGLWGLYGTEAHRYKQTEVGVIPEEWEVDTLGEYATFRTIRKRTS